MIKKNYFEFRYMSLLESIIKTKEDFIQLFRRIDHDYARIIVDLIDTEVDVKTSFNGLQISHKRDKINFIPDSQFQRVSDGNKFDRKASEADVGRLVRSLLIARSEPVSDVELEKFVNLYKAEWDKLYGEDLKYDIVKGEDIRYWYSGRRYLGRGSLSNSCMRYDHCQYYLDIYVQNPEVCKLVILTEKGKLRARALLWDTDEGLYLDRIYSSDESDVNLLTSWLTAELGSKKFLDFRNIKASSTSYVEVLPKNNLKVKVDNFNFDSYPYLDSLKFLILEQDSEKNVKNAYLTNIAPDDSSNRNLVILILESTGGMVESRNHVFSEKYQKWYHRDEAHYSDTKDDYLPDSEFFYSRYHGDWIHEDDSIYSPYIDDYIYREESFDHPEHGIIDKNWLKVFIEPKDRSTYPHILAKCISSAESVEDISEYFNTKQVLVLPDSLDYDECHAFEFVFSYDASDAIYVTDGKMPKYLTIPITKIYKSLVDEGSDLLEKLKLIDSHTSYLLYKPVADLPNVKEFIGSNSFESDAKLATRVLGVFRPEAYFKTIEELKKMKNTKDIIDFYDSMHELAMKNVKNYKNLYQIVKNQPTSKSMTETVFETVWEFFQKSDEIEFSPRELKFSWRFMSKYEFDKKEELAEKLKPLYKELVAMTFFQSIINDSDSITKLTEYLISSVHEGGRERGFEKEDYDSGFVRDLRNEIQELAYRDLDEHVTTSLEKFFFDKFNINYSRSIEMFCNEAKLDKKKIKDTLDNLLDKKIIKLEK